MRLIAAVAVALFALPCAMSAQAVPPGAVEVCRPDDAGDGLECWYEYPGQEAPGDDLGGGGGGGAGVASAPAVTCTYTRPSAPSNPNPGADESSRVQISAGGPVLVLYLKECSDGTGGWRWLPEPPPGAPLPAPADLVPGARGELEKKLPKPTWHTPAEAHPKGWAIVNTPTFFWLDDGVWSEQSAEASFGPVWVRAAAEPVKIVIDPGDHRGYLECPFDPPAYVRGTPTEHFSDCNYRYLNSSAVADNGKTFVVSVSLVWHATWEGSGGTGGDLGEMITRADPRDLAVAEIQAIITSHSSD